MYEYPLWLLLFVILPLTFLWIWKFKKLKKYKKVFFHTIIGAIIVAFPWDYIAIKERIWYFTKPHIFGIWLLGLPIEEWFFIVFVTLLFSSITVLLWEKFNRK